MSDLINIRPVGVELFHADGHSDERTDMTKLITAFRNFANAHKKTGEKRNKRKRRETKGRR
jgi:hypothetical protein